MLCYRLFWFSRLKQKRVDYGMKSLEIRLFIPIKEQDKSTSLTTLTG